VRERHTAAPTKTNPNRPGRQVPGRSFRRSGAHPQRHWSRLTAASIAAREDRPDFERRPAALARMAVNDVCLEIHPEGQSPNRDYQFSTSIDAEWG
jgi:hypothetical protein